MKIGTVFKKLIFSLALLLAASTIFPVFAQEDFIPQKNEILIPQTNEEAKRLFSQKLPLSLLLTLVENPDYTRIDNAFWHKDKLGNTYYRIFDNSKNRYGILKINFQTNNYKIFYASNFLESSKIKNSCSIPHFDISADGRLIFLELFVPNAINKLICVDTQNQTKNQTETQNQTEKYTTLLEQKSTGWNNSSLVYSDASQVLYYYTLPGQQRKNHKNLYYDIGLYRFPIDVNSENIFKAENLQRYFNLPEWIIKDAYKAFIDIAKPDYAGFLDWIYYFADKACLFTFITSTDDGKTLSDEKALEYAIKNQDFRSNNIYLYNSVVKIEDGKPIDSSALSTVANSSILTPINDQSVTIHWLLKTDEGIWLIKENRLQKKQTDGNFTWKNEYYTASLIESQQGHFALAHNSMDKVKIKAACDDALPTIQSVYNSLIYKDYETNKWNIFKDDEEIECVNYEAVLELAKNLLQKSTTIAASKTDDTIQAPEAEKQAPVKKAQDTNKNEEAATQITRPSNQIIQTTDDAASPQEYIQEDNQEKNLKDNPLATEEAEEEKELSKLPLTTDSTSAEEALPKRRNLIIILLTALSLLCLIELAVILIILSKKFSQHLSKKDKRFIFNIQEQERTKLSHDIHDSIVQNIRAIRLDAEMLKVLPESENNKQRVIEEMTNVIGLLRNICYNFHPVELSVQTDNTELISIIDTLCQQFIARTKIPCHIQIQKDFVPPQMDTEKSTNVIRVIQEALANIEKHSYATNVQLVIQSEGDEKDTKTGKMLVIFVIDDGIGCEVNKLGKGKMNFGIRNMKERIAAAGGEIEFFSTPNEGLSVQLRIPY